MLDIMLGELIKLYERDLDKLYREIDQYEDESKLWILDGSIRNSAGNLAWHLVGNLNHFIGSILGSTGYIRNRPGEFSDKDIPKEELLNVIHQTKEMVLATLSSITEEQIETKYPIEVFGSPMSTSFFLLHLHSHINYHMGQINYHRRILT